MNIQIPYSWLKEFVDAKLPAKKLAAELSLSGPSVERVYKMAEISEALIVGKVAEIKKHPDADLLKIAMTDAGEENLRQIVCGGRNLREGMLVIVALPGTKIKWHGEGDWITLEEAVIRGVKSQGMICAAAEVGLGHIFTEADRMITDISFTKAKPGEKLSDILGLDEEIFDIEVTSNRMDMLSVVGLARETSVITGGKFLYHDLAPRLGSPRPELGAKAGSSDGCLLKVEVEDKNLCPRYSAMVMDNVEVKESPWWMRKRLIVAGLRPINNIVDITNYVMLEMGQSTHAFDWDKLKDGKIIVRRAKNGEKITALDGKEYELNDKNLVIADSEKPVSIAGVIGGQHFSISQDTKTIVIESAVFDPYSIRKTSRGLNLLTDAALRYEKGLSTEGTLPHLRRLVELVEKLAGGRAASKLVDIRKEKYKPKVAKLDLPQVERFLGIEISEGNIKRILNKLGFSVKASGQKLSAVVPYWRDHDVEMDQDLIEEIARIYGYHNLPSELPASELAIEPLNWQFYWEDKVKQILSGAGITEIYSYSFVSEECLRKVEIDPDNCLKLLNPLSEDWTHLRMSLVPSMLQAVSENQERRDSFRLFELAKVYVNKATPRCGSGQQSNKAKFGDELLPEEKFKLCGAVVGKNDQVFFEAKGILELLFKKMGIKNVEFKVLPARSAVWQIGKTANVEVAGKTLGQVGIVNNNTAKKFGIEKKVALFNLDFERLIEHVTINKAHEPLPKYPAIELDLAFEVEKNVLWEDVRGVVSGLNNELVKRVELFDVYEGRGVAEGKKSIAFLVEYRSEERTLKLEEAEGVQKEIVGVIEGKLGGKLRSV